MRKRNNLIKAGTILGYVTAFIYILITALLYSLSNSLFWLSLVLAAISLYSSLFAGTLRVELENDKIEGKNKTKFLVNSIVSIVSPISFALYLIVLIKKYDSVNDDVKVFIPEEKEKNVTTKKWYKKSNFIVSCIGLGTLLLSSFVARIGETSGFKVQTTDFTLTKELTDKFNTGEENALNGKNFTISDPALKYSVTEYRPKTATKENPAPVVFVMPGFTRTKTTMAQYAIELSKRGVVTYVIDPGSQGGTTYAGYETDDEGNKDMISSTVAANGLDYLVQYVYNDTERFTYIDRDRFGAVGHSAGGGNVGQVAQDFAGKTYEESIIKSLYISGYIKLSLANRFKDFRCNAALSYAYYDEGAYRYQENISAFEVVAKRFINEVNDNNLGYEDAIIDYEYGSMDNGTYRVIHREMTNHCFEMYDGPSISNTINFFRRAFELDTNLDDTSHTWLVKEGFNGLALVGSFMFIFALLAFIIDMVPWFKSFKVASNSAAEYERKQRIKYGYTTSSSVINKENSSIIKPQKKHFSDKVIFWTTTALTAIIACLDYIPLARLTMDWFPDAANNTYTFFFPARMMNAVMLWALFNGSLGFILLLGVKALENLYFKLTNQPDRISWYRFKGMKVKWMDLLKTVCLALFSFLLFYGLLQVIYWIFHQDFRFTLVSASPLQPRFIVTWLIYLLPFFVFYLSNSVRVNLSIATEGWSEFKVNLLSGIANSIGLVFILVLNYFCYFKTGTVFYGYYSPNDTSEMWLFVNMVFGIIPMMFILPILNRFCFKKSGNVYLGAMITCMIFIMMSLSASVSYIPM